MAPPTDTPDTPSSGTPGAGAPEHTVRTVPEGALVYGMQLPIQSQSNLYVEEWERTSGPPELARVARAADESGFFYVAVCDHTFIPHRAAAAMGTVWYDTVGTLGWLAGVTEHVRLLSHVYIAALRHPLRAANEFATLDVLSGGRVIVGVGAGHVAEEFDVLGSDFAGRGALTDEAVRGIAAALEHEFPELPGPRWPVRDAGVAPRPVQRPRPPIWIGGSSRPALRRAAALGDGWLPQTVKRSDLRDQIGELLEFRRRFRDDAPIDIGALAGVLHVGTPTRELPPGTITGSPRAIADNLNELAALGVSHVQLRFPSRSVDELVDQMTAFGAEVAPLLPG
jgi:probable F420-dependent oxidoreductase